MTVLSDAVDGSGDGDGVTTQFPYNGRIDDPLDIRCFIIGVDSVRRVPTFTVSGDQSGGTVSITSGAPLVGETVILYRDTLLRQSVNYQAGNFPSETHERNADKLIMAAQERKAVEAVSLRFERGSPPIPEMIPFLKVGSVLASKEGGGFGEGPTVGEIANAEGFALRAETAADRVDLGALDDAVQATADDVLLTGEDANQTSQDRLATAADRVATASDVLASTGLLASTEVVRDATASIAAISGAYRDTTIVAAKAQGVAALAVGQTFAAAADDVDYIGLYLIKTGPIAAEIGQLPIAAVLRALQAKLPDVAPVGYAWAVIDQDDRVALGIREDGTLDASAAVMAALEVGSLSFTGTSTQMDGVTPDGYVWAIRDVDDRVAMGLSAEGVFRVTDAKFDTLNGVSVASIIAPDEGSASLGAQNFSADIVHLISYGQSLSVGVGTFSAITTAQRFDNLRFVGGVRAQDADATGADKVAKYGSLIPLIESGPGAETAYETPMGGVTDSVKELIASENAIVFSDHQYQLLASAPGDGGRTIAELANPAGIYYLRLLDDVTYGLLRAQEAGKTYKVGAIFWTQGESDGDNADYATELIALRSALDAAIKAITGQTDDVQMICYQLPRPRQSEYFLEAMASDPLITIACPTYQLAKSDGVHLTPESSKIMGAYYGVAYKRRVIDGFDDWVPCMALSHFRQGSMVDVKFNVPSGALSFDTTAYPVQTNFGFRLFDTDGTTELPITDVSITKRDTVRITAAAAIPAGALLRYGSYDPVANATDRDITGGNLRDTAGGSLIFDGGGLDHPMHNWALLFARTL